MMQRWWIVALAGTTLLGCQLENSSEVVSDLVRLDSGDPCKAVLPQAVIFDGKQQPPIAEAGQVWVIVPSTKVGEMTAALVSADKAAIAYLAILPRGSTGGFVDRLGLVSQAVFPGHPNPPPPVIDPDLLVFYARRALDGVALAEADLKSCNL
jgi:hypothetical protein